MRPPPGPRVAEDALTEARRPPSRPESPPGAGRPPSRPASSRPPGGSAGRPAALSPAARATAILGLVSVALAAILLPALPALSAAGGRAERPHRAEGDARGRERARPHVAAESWVEREAWLMGTRLRIRLASRTREEGVAGTELAFAEVSRLDSLLSTWRPDSELARLNAAEPGRPVRIGAELAGLLAEAAGLSRLTGGAFDPGVGPLIDAWGLRGEGRRPSPAELRRAMEAAGVSGFGLEEGGTAVRRREGAWLDSGGFGKGAALRAAAAILRRSGVERALLDFGGQILAVGAGEVDEAVGEGEAEAVPRGRDGAATGRAPAGWRVAVAHPSRREEPAALLLLRDVSAATSAASERFVVADGERLGHILDPRSGRPAPAWGSVTVVAADPLVADALSTALFVLGPQEGLRWSEREGVAALFLSPAPAGLSAEWTSAMEPWLLRVPGMSP